MKIQIDYNTISFESKIFCNDETIQNNLKQTIGDSFGKRITDWFETFINRIKEEINNDTFSVEIKGCDFYEKVFIDSVLNKENGLIDKKLIEVVDEKWIDRNYNNIDAFLDFALNSTEDIVKETVKPNIENIKSIRSNKVEVPVIATMSSGKSTLLNALIGQDFLFEDTGTATATTCNIKINNKLENFIAQAIDKETILEESYSDISAFLRNWNSSANQDNYSNLRLNLEGPVEHLNSSSLELNFIDTPGPNSAQYENHTKKTYNYLKDNQKLPIVLYVLDPEKMDSKDDDNTLREISEVLKNNEQNLDRIIFIYNKVDREELDKKPFSEILPKIRKFLGKYNIENPKVFPLSAKYAKLAQLSSTLSRNERNKLKGFRNDFIPEPEENYPGYQLLDYTPLTKDQKQQLRKNISKSELDSDLVYSGLAAIKLYIQDYITCHHQKRQYKDLFGISYKIANAIQTKLNLQKANLEEKTAEEQKKSRERDLKEREELNNRKTQALVEINKIEVDRKFIDAATKKIDKEFSNLKNKSLRKYKLDSEEASQLLKEINNTIANLRVSIQTDLVSRMNDESRIYLQKLKNEVDIRFESNTTSLETKTFNADLLNKINVLDINKIEKFKRKEEEYEEYQIEVKVTSDKWYKRWFGFKDTKIRHKTSQKQKEVVEFAKFYNSVVDPISKQFNKMIIDCNSEFEKIFRDYKNSFVNLVNFSFEEAMRNVYENSSKELAFTNKEKEIRLKKLDRIKKDILKFKIQEYNEKIYRESAVAC